MQEHDRRPYLKHISTLFPLVNEWKRFDNELGYTVVHDPRVALLMQKEPPPLAAVASIASASATPAPSEHKHPRYHEILEAVREKYGDGLRLALAKVLLDMYEGEKPKPPPPAPLPPPAPGVETRNQCKPPPPFDLLDIPKAMEAQGWPKAAKLARRWLNGRKHSAPTASTASYDEDMLDTDTLSLNWVLGFGSAKKQYAQLLETAIYSEAAKKALIKPDGVMPVFMKKDRFFSGKLLTWDYCKGDIQELHRQFQFQFTSVNTWAEMARQGVTELMAALGDFNLYAAIAEANIYTSQFNRYDSHIEWYQCTRSTVTITHLYLYAKDSYSFADRDEKKASQYLGHWNKHGVVLSLSAIAAELATAIPSLFQTERKSGIERGNYPIDTKTTMVDDYGRPIDLGPALREKDVYYPVRNRDYQQWRECHQRGGDFVIYTDFKRVKLATPIVLKLEDVCKRIK